MDTFRETSKMSGADIGASHPCHIDSDDLMRWAAIASRLEAITPVVLATVSALHINRCHAGLARCADAARFAAKIAGEPERTIAVTLAEDFERHAVRGH